MTYETKDLILPMLKLKEPVTIRITEDEKYLRLYVGPRDWQFSKETGKCVGAGTGLDCRQGASPPLPSEQGVATET